MINLGMYTGLRAKVIIKPEYRDEFAYISSGEVRYEWSNSRIDFLKEYGAYSRATFIPCGGLAYMPDSWETPDERATDGFQRHFNKESGAWNFQCSLKNYEDTIEYFIENVLSKVVEQVIHLETYYEECIYSTLYELVDDKIIEKAEKGIKYGEEEEPYGYGYY